MILFFKDTTELLSQSAPLTGATINANASTRDEMLYVVPVGTIAALTISLPTAANSRQGQVIRIFTRQIILALTLNVAGGGTILGNILDTSSINSSTALQCVSTSGNGTWVVLYPQ